jgi:hypothetical protein
MKISIFASLLVIFASQAATAANCSGYIYQYKKVKSDQLQLRSMQSAYFDSGKAECVSHVESSWIGRSTTIQNCVQVEVSQNKITAIINGKERVGLVEARTLNLPYDTGTHLEAYFARDINDGRFKLAGIVDLKNNTKDVLAIGVNCK